MRSFSALSDVRQRYYLLLIKIEYFFENNILRILFSKNIRATRRVLASDFWILKAVCLLMIKSSKTICVVKNRFFSLNNISASLILYFFSREKQPDETLFDNTRVKKNHIRLYQCHEFSKQILKYQKMLNQNTNPFVQNKLMVNFKNSALKMTHIEMLVLDSAFLSKFSL